MDVVLPEDTCITTTKDNEYKELKYPIPQSNGALSMLLSLKMRLIPVIIYMKGTYYPVEGSPAETTEAFYHFLLPKDMPRRITFRLDPQFHTWCHYARRLW